MDDDSYRVLSIQTRVYLSLPAAPVKSHVIEEVLLGAAVLLVELVKVGAELFADGVALAEFGLVDGGHLREDVLVVGLVAFGDVADVFDDLLLAVVVDLAGADVFHNTGDDPEDELEVRLVFDVADGWCVLEGFMKCTTVRNGGIAGSCLFIKFGIEFVNELGGLRVSGRC